MAVPLLFASILSLVFVIARFVAHWRGLKLRDHLDDRQHQGFWAITSLVFIVSICEFILALPALIVVIPPVVWCTGCVFYLGFVAVRRANGPKERILSVAGALVFLATICCLISVAVKIDYQPSWSWGLTLTPFFLLCCFPLVGPVLSCSILKILPPHLDCSHQWNCQRADPAEAVVFGTAGVFSSLFLLPLLSTLLLLLPRLEGLPSSRPCIFSLLPLLVELLFVFSISLLGFIRSLRLCAVSLRARRS